MQKSISQSELARNLGLSDWTVSRAINGHPSVKEETRQRVLAAMEEMGFQSNPLALGLAGKKTGMIGISFNSLRSSILLEELASFNRFLEDHRLSGLLMFNDRVEANELKAIANFRRLSVDAVVLVQSSLSTEKSIKALAGLVSLHVDPVESHQGCVVKIDRDHGVKLLVDHLVALGHRHFGTLGINQDNIWRWPGLLKALESHGLDPSTQLKHYVPLDRVEQSYEMGIHSAQMVMEDRQAPTALIAINDHVAFAAAQYLKNHGLDVPGRFSITGFDHLEIADHLFPTLTTIDPEPHLLMEVAGNMLVQRLNDIKGASEGGLRIITPKLIIGNSTGRAPTL